MGPKLRFATGEGPIIDNPGADFDDVDMFVDFEYR